MSEKIKLFRVENPNIPPDPRAEGKGGTSHPEIRGQWFSDRLDKALSYLPKSTQHKPKGSGIQQFIPVDGAVVHIAEIDKSQIDLYRAENHPIVQEMGMDIEPFEDYILPPEAIIDTVSVDKIVGDSRGRMNRLDERKAATDRVRGAIALKLSQAAGAD